jgi:hypothetical protein
MLKALKVAIYDNLNLRQNASPGREGKRIEEEKKMKIYLTLKVISDMRMFFLLNE